MDEVLRATARGDNGTRPTWGIVAFVAVWAVLGVAVIYFRANRK